MKKISVQILHPNILELIDEPIAVSIDEKADIVKIISDADDKFSQITKGSFPIENLSSLLQLLWDVKNWEFFEDVGIEARTSNGAWIPLRADPDLVIPPDADIKLNPDAGC